MVEWLEGFLREYSGGIAVISHDRYFLDRVTNRTFAMEQGRGTLYPGNYSKFICLQEEQQEAEQRAYHKQQKWIEKTEAFVDKYRAGIKSKQARGRQSQLGRVDRLSKPGESQTLSDIIFEPSVLSGEKVLHLTDINQNFGDRTVLAGITISIRRGEGVALIGPNGAGKTTLLKLITGAIKPASGQVRIGSKVKMGYFSQHHESITSGNSVLAEIVNEYGFTENVARKYLAVFLFQGDDVFKRIGDLSGGEKARIVMLKLLLSGANFLVLDEPTNHLDIPSKEAFESALQNYTGTFLVVSHDRYFLDQTVNRVLEIEQSKICDYVGDYSYYQTKKRERCITQNTIKQATANAKSIKSPKKEKQKTNYAKIIAQMEKEIAALEEEIKKVEQLLNDERVCASYEKMNEMANTYTKLTLSLNEKMAQWESLMDQTT
jgi:ATP-binding cassette subfamily F protein 3